MPSPFSETALGKEHPETAKAYLNLATFYQIRRRDRGAAQLYLRAIEILEPVYGKDHWLVLIASDAAPSLSDSMYRPSARKTSASSLRASLVT